MKLHSVFTEGGNIPARYTCDGEDVLPPLTISDVPTGTKSLALIVDDPDATRGGTWTHLVAWNFDPERVTIDEQTLIRKVELGTNDFEQIEYGGPCPPRGKAHRYMFKLYALDITLTLTRGITKDILLSACEGHVIAKCELLGMYERH